jgi:hypothetical protein
LLTLNNANELITGQGDASSLATSVVILLLTLPHMMQSALSTSALGVLFSGQPDSFLYRTPSPAAAATAGAGMAPDDVLLLLPLQMASDAPPGVIGTSRPCGYKTRHKSI